MLEFIYAHTNLLESALRCGAPPEQTLRQAIEFLDFVEQHPYPTVKITLPAIPPLSDEEVADPTPVGRRPPGSPAETIELNAELMEARQCRVLAERLLATVTSHAGSQADSVTVALSMKFAARIIGLIEWYNGAVASHWHGREAATELAERKSNLSIKQARRAAGNAELSADEKAWVIAALVRETKRGLTKSEAARKISAKLIQRKFPKINRSVELLPETLRKYF